MENFEFQDATVKCEIAKREKNKLTNLAETLKHDHEKWVQAQKEANNISQEKCTLLKKFEVRNINFLQFNVC